MLQQTKICIDLDRCETEFDFIKSWVESGADALMIRCDRQTGDRWREATEWVRALERSVGRPIPVILDLPNAEFAEGLFREGATNEVDLIAVSAVGGGASIHKLRNALKSNASVPQVVARFDAAGAFQDIESIVDAADAVTITLEGLQSVAPSQSPVVQKQISRHCQIAAKPCLVQRDSLCRLATSPHQQQPDVFDLANIVFDHADGVLLSADQIDRSSVVQSMRTVRGILVSAEAYLEVTDRPVRVGFGQPPNTAALAYAIRHILKMQEIAAVAVYSMSGTTARVISKNWLDAPILGISPNLATARRMSLYHGVASHHLDRPLDTGEVLKTAGELAKRWGIAVPGDRIIVVSGHPHQTQEQANGFVVETVG